MSALDSAHGAAPVEMLDARSRMTASVTTTVTLPPDALTIVVPPPLPEMISQINVEQVLGLPSRTYLELLRERNCTIAVTCVGKLRLVDRTKFRGWLEARGKAKRATAAKENRTSDAEDAETVEELDRLGFKPVPPVEQR